MDKIHVYLGFSFTLIARKNIKTIIGMECTYPRYFLVSDFREKLTKFVFIKGWYFAVSLHEEEANQITKLPHQTIKGSMKLIQDRKSKELQPSK